jgi:hypothetical protein
MKVITFILVCVLFCSVASLDLICGRNGDEYPWKFNVKGDDVELDFGNDTYPCIRGIEETIICFINAMPVQTTWTFDRKDFYDILAGQKDSLTINVNTLFNDPKLRNNNLDCKVAQNNLRSL